MILTTKFVPPSLLYIGGGGGGAIFPTSDDLQIFFGALYHEMVRTSPELKGSDDFLSRTPVPLYSSGLPQSRSVIML